MFRSPASGPGIKPHINETGEEYLLPSWYVLSLSPIGVLFVKQAILGLKVQCHEISRDTVSLSDHQKCTVITLLKSYPFYLRILKIGTSVIK